MRSSGVLQRFFSYLIEYGPADTWRRGSSALASMIYASRVRKRIQPKLHWLSEHASAMHLSGEELVRRHFANDTDADLLRRIDTEYEEAARELRNRYAEVDLRYPANWAVERGSSYLIYAVTRLLRPRRVVETGVANGASSFFFLRALIKNGEGTLCSIDIDEKAGCLLNDNERQAWHFETLKSPYKKNFTALVRSAAPIDLFLHDSDHWYGWTQFEFSTVLPLLSADGVLICDDADYSLAFADFCSAHRLDPIYLVETRKVFGLTRPRPPQSRTAPESHLVGTQAK